MERWQINRAGVINFWYYDDEEFYFENGRLLLRGANGSGKSVTMQSLIPLLFDGNKSPERLDPFGSRARKMDSYLLSEGLDLEERTGYLFLEFNKPESQRFMTIGMGMRARKNMQTQTWYFIVQDNRRVGINHELSLYKDVGKKLPLTRKELENKLGAGGQLFTRQSDYKAAVNEQLFGYTDITDFDELITLLIQIRSPKLSKEFKPTTMYEIMQNSLFTLSEEDLRPMSEAIENMDEVKEKIDTLQRAKKSLDKIALAYEKYNQYILAYKANAFKVHHKDQLNMDKNIKKLEKSLIKENNDLLTIDSTIKELEEEENLLRQKENQLRENDLSKLSEQKIDLENRLIDLDEHIKKKMDNLEKYESELIQITHQKNDSQESIDLSNTAILSIYEALRSYAETPKYDECEFMITDHQNSLNDFNFIHYKNHLSDNISKVKTGLSAIRTYHQTEEKFNRILEEKDQTQKIYESQERKVREYEQQFNSIKEEHASHIISWHAHNQVFTFERDIINKAVERVFQFGELYSYESVKEPIVKSYQHFQNSHHQQISVIDGQKQNLNEKIQDQLSELDILKNLKEPEPERSLSVRKNRERLKSLDIPFLPFYKALDFTRDLDEKLKNGLEEALLSLGLLDALIIDPKHKDQVLTREEGLSDTYIFSKPHILSHNLSVFLQVEKEATVDTSFILDALQSILIDSETDTYISESGLFGNGILIGQISGTYTSNFISYHSRKRYKEEQMEQKRKEMNLLKEQVSALEVDAQKIRILLEEGAKEYQTMPSKEDLELAHTDWQEQLQSLKISKKEYDKKLELLENVSNELKDAQRVRHEKTHALYLTLTIEVYEEALDALDDYKESLYDLIRTHDNRCNQINLLESITSRYDQVMETLDETRYDISINERDKRECLNKLDIIELQLKEHDYALFMAQLKSVKDRLSVIPEEKNTSYQKKTDIGSAMQINQNDLNVIQLNKKAINRKVQLYEWALLSEWALEYVTCHAEDETPQKISTAILNTYGTVLDEGKNILNLGETLNGRFHEEQGLLVEYNMKMTTLFKETPFENIDENDMMHIERVDITSRMQGKKVSFKEMLLLIHNQIETNQNVLDEQDRQLFEEILIKSVSRKISSKIYHSEKWVKEIDALMSNLDTSSGLKFNLRWITKNAVSEDQMSTRELVDILKGEQSLLTKQQRERLIQHFRSKINESKNRLGTEDHRSFLTIMKDVLDYRKWFEFQLYFTKPGESKKELTNNAFFTFSGGEKAMAMYVPLFSAVYAKYQSGAKDCPKVISLDEAFAGVDEKNIKDMFKLLVKLDLSFIANSQVLFGDYETVPSLGIYELIRPENVTFVTLIRYLWNGHIRQMVIEDE